MSALIYSAQMLCNSTLCAAAGCPEFAEPGWALCSRCDRKRLAGKTIELHEPPALDGPTLECCGCKEFLPDALFSRKSDAPTRRFRHQECRSCGRKRRAIRMSTETPEQREARRKAEQVKRNKRRRIELRIDLQHVREARNDPTG